MERPLLVLDLDETLIFGAESPLPRPCDLRIGRFFIYWRPYLDCFLKRMHEYFDIAIWSSASEDYVEEITNALSAFGTRHEFVWARQRCTKRFDFIQKEEYFLKDLRKLKRKGYKLARILIVEDEPRKVWRNYGNAIYVRPYHGEVEDNELKLLASYLSSLSHSGDFRTVEKRRWRDEIR